MEIFYHSDDACLTTSSTEKIIDCWKAGLLDGFSVMANRNYLLLVKSALLQNSDKPIQISVHLNLTDFVSISDPVEIPLLVYPDGRFKIKFLNAFLYEYFNSKRKDSFLNQVRKEWDLQIQTVKHELGDRVITGINSHNYLHLLPGLFQIARELQLKYDIPSIRIPNEPFYFAKMTHTIKRFYLLNTVKYFTIKYFVNRIDAMQIKEKINSIGILYSGKMFIENIKPGIKKILETSDENTEIVFHIGKSRRDELDSMVNSKQAISFFASEDRERELQTLYLLKDEKK